MDEDLFQQEDHLGGGKCGFLIVDGPGIVSRGGKCI